MQIQIITFSNNDDSIRVNGDCVSKHEINHDDKCYVYFHTGKHNFNFGWSNPNDLQTDILYVRKIENEYGININFVDLSGVLSSMIQFSSKYPSLNINVASIFEDFYREFLFKLSEMNIDK